jgi:hypothetical protein
LQKFIILLTSFTYKCEKKIYDQITAQKNNKNRKTILGGVFTGQNCKLTISAGAHRAQEIP